MKLTLYEREGCHLCEEALVLLEWLCEDYPIEVERVDISTDPELEIRYMFEIPVIVYEGEIVSQGRPELLKIEDFVKNALTF